MKVGKLPEPVLVRSVLRQVGHRRGEVLMGPSVGVDCAALALAPDEILVMSSDPITGAVEDIGGHCIHITANDLAASGADPIGVMLTVLLPDTVEEAEIRKMVQDAEKVCQDLNMEIFGGHTEITNVVRHPVISVTGVGKIKKTELLSPEQIRPGQDVVISKWIGLEATTILAKERRTRLLERFSPGFLEEARKLDQYLSVVPDARAVRGTGVVTMHDITEGGVFGALWEVAQAGGVGLEIDLKAIPIRQETVEICEFFGVNPYLIMSSGSMLMVTEDGPGTVDALEKAGIPGTLVGRTTKGNDRILRNGQEIRYLDRPQPDELYRALEERKK